ncbi:MAG: phage virion morphogenesis protein [Dehalococcoidales bacterium]|nr:phage virion morphogenesis protein [Dehalococcoidales bacterium]
MIDMKVVGTTQVIDNLNRTRPVLRQERKTAVTRASVYLMNYVQRNKLSGQVLKRRTGRLASSMGYKVEESGDSFSGRVGSPVEYAAIHETGGTIRATRTRYLTIPMPAALTPAGVVRKPARRWLNTFVRTVKGNKYIFSKEGGRAVPIFLLKQTVKIPKRPYIAPSVAEVKDKIIEMVGAGVKVTVNTINRGH